MRPSSDRSRETGRASANPRQRLLFGWGYEDEQVELDLMPAGGRILAAAGSGEMATHLAAAGLRVTAVGANHTQIAYATSRSRGGAFESGSAERFMDIGRALIRAASPAWSRGRMVAFLEERSDRRAVDAWRTKLDNRTFRSILKATLGPAGTLAAAAQRDFARPIPAHFDETIRSRIAEAVERHSLRDNRFAWRLLLGEELPGFEMPRPAEGMLDFVETDILGHMEQVAPGSYDGITLSNVVDGASADYVRDLRRASIRAVQPGGPIVVRTFRATVNAESAARADGDRSLIWGSIDVVQ